MVNICLYASIKLGQLDVVKGPLKSGAKVNPKNTPHALVTDSGCLGEVGDTKLPKYVEQSVPNSPGGGRLCKIRTRSYLSVCFSFRAKQSGSTIDLIDNLQ